MFKSYIVQSGEEVFTSGLCYEERDSSLSFDNFAYKAENKDAGYIMLNPSGTKYFAKAVNKEGSVSSAEFKNHFDAIDFMKENL